MPKTGYLSNRSGIITSLNPFLYCRNSKIKPMYDLIRSHISWYRGHYGSRYLCTCRSSRQRYGGTFSGFVFFGCRGRIQPFWPLLCGIGIKVWVSFSIIFGKITSNWNTSIIIILNIIFRVPKAGSAYVYSYVTVGEIIGFVIGWNLILEYAIGTASVARGKIYTSNKIFFGFSVKLMYISLTGYSGYLDSLTSNRTMANAFQKYLPMNIPHMSPYPDLCAFLITLLLTLVLSWGKYDISMKNIELVHEKKSDRKIPPINYFLILFLLQVSNHPRA